jgi:hypothetical protein
MKEMNGPAATAEHLTLTSETLSMFINMRRGLRKLVIHRKECKDGYNPDFTADAGLVTAYLLRKIEFDELDEPPELEFDCDFWYTFTKNPANTLTPPSDICEEGALKVADYLVRNQKFIVEIREKIVILNDANEEEEVGDLYGENDESDENAYDSD